MGETTLIDYSEERRDEEPAVLRSAATKDLPPEWRRSLATLGTTAPLSDSSLRSE
jgi:hypothetical protein